MLSQCIYYDLTSSAIRWAIRLAKIATRASCAACAWTCLGAKLDEAGGPNSGAKLQAGKKTAEAEELLGSHAEDLVGLPPGERLTK